LAPINGRRNPPVIETRDEVDRDFDRAVEAFDLAQDLMLWPEFTRLCRF
jgi:hypothetical protein